MAVTPHQVPPTLAAIVMPDASVLGRRVDGAIARVA